VLVAAGAFGSGLQAQRVADAIASGLRDGGWEADPCALSSRPGTARSPRGDPDFDARMLAARAVVIAQARLHEDTLAATDAFELATRARQSGVPAYAIAAENRLDAFDARILDLQTIIEARTHRSLRAAGRKLATLV
jgi:glycerate kinase